MSCGTIQVFTRTGGDAPVSGVNISIYSADTDKLLVSYQTDDTGFSPPVSLAAPPRELSLDEANTRMPYAIYNLSAELDGYKQILISGVQVFEGENSLLELSLIAANPSAPLTLGTEDFVIEPHHLYTNEGGASRGPSDTCPGWVLNEVSIPKSVVVHLGTPSSNARNVTVPFVDYIKNVACCEIYPTWPVESLKANIYAQISLVMNRIFTEWYLSKGKTFTITGSPSYDQKYEHGRNIFENISKLVDEIFNTYIRKQGTVNPYFAEYCDGKTVSCKGMKQWGTVTYANQGLSALSILRKYYTNIELVTTNNIKNIPNSYGGTPLKIGSTGTDVRILQRQLNRIAKDYPFMGTEEVNGVFSATTAARVKKFQKQFSLTQDGVVGKSTWYKISYIYVSVTHLAQLTSEGEKPNGEIIPPAEGSWPNVVYRIGSRGANVERIQFYLNAIGKYNPSIPTVATDGIFGVGTETAVKAFQTLKKIPVDGAVGKVTWDSLYKEYNSIQTDENTDQNAPGAYPGKSFSQGSSGNYVKTIQFWLSIISTNFSSIPNLTPDGVFGAQTTASVKAFQSFFGLTVDGIVGKATWQKLSEVFADVCAELLPPNVRPGTYPGTPLKVGSKGTAVKEMQFYLYILSAYYTSIPTIAYDGIFGTGTKNAVVAFQKLFNLTPDGIVGTQTWNKLYATFLQFHDTNGSVFNTKQIAFQGTTLTEGSDGTQVSWVQYMLNVIGEYYDTITPVEESGFYDEFTTASVKSFQSTFNLPDTGNVNDITFNALVQVYYSVLAQVQFNNGTTQDSTYPGFVLAENSSGSAVWQLQFYMNEIAARFCVLQYVPQNGFFGVETKDAVMAFQEGFNLQVTGIVDKATWDAIYSYYISA